MASSRDLLFVVDATSSMTYFLQGVQNSLPQVMKMSAITGLVERMGILVYRDFDCRDVLEFSGWSTDTDVLTTFLAGVRPIGGGDQPEAVRTAMKKVMEVVTGPTLVVLYTDAPPHHPSMFSCKEHLEAEKKILGPHDFDWVTICRKAEIRDIKVFAIIERSSNDCTTCWYPFMSLVTGGATVSLERRVSADRICQQTVGLFLSWIGYEYDFGSSVLVTVPDPKAALQVDSEKAAIAAGILPPPHTRACSLANLDSRMQRLQRGQVRIERMMGTDVLDKFRRDAGYQATIFGMFDNLLEPASVVSLTYNTLFGQLWRAICKRRDDPRRETLLAKMSSSVSSLQGTSQQIMKQYIEASYDQSDVVAAMIGPPRPPSVDQPILVLETGARLPRAELLEISRSCSPKVVSKVSCLLTGLRVVTSGSVPAIYLPLSLGAKDLFAALPHLMCPGTMFSRRPAALLAILTAISGHANPLFDKAVAFLASIRGKWIDESQPENASLDLVRLLLKYPPALTEGELEMCRHLNRVGGLRINAQTDVEAVVGYTSKKTVRPDDQRQCVECHKRRPSTLIAADHRCAACQVGEEIEEDSKTVWCECSSCQVHYAVMRPDDLKVKPKCHFCRLSQPAPKRQCGLCRNHFMDQLPAESGSFVCAPCAVNGSALTETVTVPLRTYAEENGLDWAGLQVTDPAFWSGRSLFHVKHLVQPAPAPAPDKAHVARGKAVHNPEEIGRGVLGWVESGRAELGTCSLCFEDLPKQRLTAFCGRRQCEAKACRGCISTWFGSFKKGSVLIPPNLSCAFCKKTPSPNTLRRHNPGLFALGPIDLDALDSAWYYGWCVGCSSIKPAVAKDCSQDVPALVAFECEDCKGRKPTLTTKDCPWCSVTIQRTGGCAHIECGNCHSHFCWLCLYKSRTSGQIYDHMSSAHRCYGYADPDDDLYLSDSDIDD